MIFGKYIFHIKNLRKYLRHNPGVYYNSHRNRFEYRKFGEPTSWVTYDEALRMWKNTAKTLHFMEYKNEMSKT